MSAQHTLGLLKAWNTELMRDGGRFRMARNITACGSSLGLIDEIEVAKANARRLAACWNACDGISTEHLERHGLPDFAQKISDLVAQRDELLETLKDCLEKGSRWHPCDPVVAKAKAAIAKADEWSTPVQRLQEWGLLAPQPPKGEPAPRGIR